MKDWTVTFHNSALKPLVIRAAKVKIPDREGSMITFCDERGDVVAYVAEVVVASIHS